MRRRPVKEDVLPGCRERDGIDDRAVPGKQAEVPCGNTAGVHDAVVYIVDLGGFDSRSDRNAEISHAEDAVRTFEWRSLYGLLFCGFGEISAARISAAAAVDTAGLAAPAPHQDAAVRAGEVLCIPQEEPDVLLFPQFFESVGKFLHIFFCKHADLDGVDPSSLWGCPCSKRHQVGDDLHRILFRCHAEMLGEGEDKDGDGRMGN